eukprot:scaffold250962_cov18-Tisochrysis_lutea.AAC.1
MAAVRATQPNTKEEQAYLQRMSAAVHTRLLEQQALQKLSLAAGELPEGEEQGTTTTNNALSCVSGAGLNAAAEVKQVVGMAQQHYTPKGTSGTSNFLSRTRRVTDLSELSALHGLPPSPPQLPPASPHQGLTALSFMDAQQSEHAPLPLQSQQPPPLHMPPPLQSQRAPPSPQSQQPPLLHMPPPVQSQRALPSLQPQQSPHLTPPGICIGGVMRALGSVASKLRHATSSASSPPSITQQQQQQSAQTQQQPLSLSATWALGGGPQAQQTAARSSSVWHQPRQLASPQQSQKLGASGLARVDSMSSISSTSTSSTRGRVVVPRRKAAKASVQAQSPGGSVSSARGEDGALGARQLNIIIIFMQTLMWTHQDCHHGQTRAEYVKHQSIHMRGISSESLALACNYQPSKPKEAIKQVSDSGNGILNSGDWEAWHNLE